jgi:hypothetical protein
MGCSPPLAFRFSQALCNFPLVFCKSSSPNASSHFPHSSSPALPSTALLSRPGPRGGRARTLGIPAAGQYTDGFASPGEVLKELPQGAPGGRGGVVAHGEEDRRMSDRLGAQQAVRGSGPRAPASEPPPRPHPAGAAPAPPESQWAEAAGGARARGRGQSGLRRRGRATGWAWRMGRSSAPGSAMVRGGVSVARQVADGGNIPG